MRIAFRFFGLLCLAAAFAALVVDGTTSVAANQIVLHPLGEMLAKISPEGFEHFHVLVTAHTPILWDPVLGSVLLLPTWCVLGLLGLVLTAVTRRPRAPIGHSRR